MENAIEVDHVTKIFFPTGSLSDLFRGRKRSVTALDGISLSVKEGEVFGLVGPNGAGKTTFIKVLSTLIHPTGGTARIHGFDVVKNEGRIRRLVGLIHSDERSFFWRLTGRQNLEFFGALFRIPKKQADQRIEELISLVGLENEADVRFHFYSTGMKQKLAIVRGLLPHPRILFMDEALRSVDPLTTQKIRSFIKEKIRKLFDGTVILATNRLSEASELCDRIAILKKGRLEACGSLKELEATYNQSVGYCLEVKSLGQSGYERIRRMPWIQDCQMSEDPGGTSMIELRMPCQEEEKIHFILQEIIRSNGHIVKVSRRWTSLEEIFNLVVGQ